ncbi:MAG TPA: hypothetical protein VF469_17660, partial [Kofleriaceae bacterium]
AVSFWIGGSFQMKKIVHIVHLALLSLLAAGGCSKKGPDCSAAVDKGVDGYIAAVKKIAGSSPRLDIAKIAGPLKAAMTQRCNDDKWQPDVVTCIGKTTSSDDLKACEEKLTRDQRAKLDAQVFSITMGGIGASGSRMPPGLDGHPAMLGAANGSAAPSGDSVGSSVGSSAPTGAAPAAPSEPPAAPKSGGW